MQPDTQTSTSVTLWAGAATQTLLLWKKGIMETPLSKLGIRVFKGFHPQNEQASRGSEPVFTLPIHANMDPACMSGPGRRYHRSRFPLHARGVPRPFHPPWPIIPFIYLFTGFYAAVLSFYERNSSLCKVEGPSQQIKTQSINMLPLGNWPPTSLYLKGMCVICKAASVCVPSDSLLGRPWKDFEMSQV